MCGGSFSHNSGNPELLGFRLLALGFRVVWRGRSGLDSTVVNCGFFSDPLQRGS